MHLHALVNHSNRKTSLSYSPCTPIALPRSNVRITPPVSRLGGPNGPASPPDTALCDRIPTLVVLVHVVHRVPSLVVHVIVIVAPDAVHVTRWELPSARQSISMLTSSDLLRRCIYNHCAIGFLNNDLPSRCGCVAQPIFSTGRPQQLTLPAAQCRSGAFPWVPGIASVTRTPGKIPPSPDEPQGASPSERPQT